VTRESEASRKQRQNQVIDRILLVTLVMTFFIWIMAHIRAASIGWTQRDWLQGLVALALITLGFLRKKIDPRIKAILLIGLLSLGGVSGVLSLGMLGGTIFMFPTAVVVAAVVYSRRSTNVFILLCLAVCSILGALIISGRIELAYDAAGIMANWSHWLVYLGCLAFFFVVAGTAIHYYRSESDRLMAELYTERDRLAAALEEVHTLSGLLPVCSACEKIRDDKDYWRQIRNFLQDHAGAESNHGICPDCQKKLYPELDDLRDE